MPTVPAHKLAQALNLTEQRVHQLVKEGVLRKEGRGQFDAIKCIRAYIRYLQGLLERDAVPPSEHQERVRLLRVQADLKEMELSKQHSQLVAIEDVEREFNDLARTTAARVMTIASRLAPELVGETSRVMIQAKLDKACRDALAHLARSRNGGGNPDTSERQHPRAISPKREAQAQ
jgi:phage terminase Nu1 subunit (DNA packaging protein)